MQCNNCYLKGRVSRKNLLCKKKKKNSGITISFKKESTFCLEFDKGNYWWGFTDGYTLLL